MSGRHREGGRLSVVAVKRAIAKDRNVSSTPPPWLVLGLGVGLGWG